MRSVRHALAAAVMLSSAAALAEPPKCFDRMMELIREQHEAKDNVSPEMLACVFWDESGFRNIENKSSGAAGFGQVLLRAQGPGFWKLVDALGLRAKMTKANLLADDALAVKAASLTFKAGMAWKKGNMLETLKTYAGRHNLAVIPSWTECAKKLVKARSGAGYNQAGVLDALKSANKHRNVKARLDPARLFDTNRCASAAPEHK